jgi:RHS repeat-associated protein
MLSAANQTVSSAYSFGAYGATAVTSSNAAPLAYAGAEFNSTDQLVYLRNRFYSPQLQRFISEDPIGIAGGMNTYAYGDGNPVNLVDPLGLWASVSVSGNTVSITLPITYSGPGATPDRIQEWNNAIERSWSGQFGKYHVTTRVTQGSQNQINVPCERARAETPPPGNSGTWPALNVPGVDPAWAAAHEAGHLMGLIDEYNRWSGIPYSSWEHDIMGALGQLPSERDITEIIKWNSL